MGKRRIFGLFSMILCLLTVFSSCMFVPAMAASGTVDLPADLTVIEAEAFGNLQNVEKVVIHDALRRIESRAFANSSVREIELPESIEFIAHNAFEGCNALTLYVYKDTYAHRWAVLNQAKHVVLDDASVSEPAYALSRLDISGNEVSVSVTTGNAPCKLVVRLLNEDDETAIVTAKTDAQANYTGETVFVSVESRPEYFILEAVLEDSKGNRLCSPVRNIRYTRAYADFENLEKPEESDSRVISFGDVGYAVLSENVRYVSGAISLGGGKYEIPSSGTRSAAPETGDILMMNIGGTYTPIKVSAVQMGADGTITVEEGGELYLSDVYDTLKVDTYAQAEMNPGEGDASVKVGNVFNYKDSASYLDGKLTLDMDAGMNVFVKVEYDKKRFGPDYFLFEVEGSVWGDATGTFTGKADTSELKKPLEIHLYNGIFMIPGIHIPAEIWVTVPIYASIEGTGTVKSHFDKTFGFTWDSDSGYQKKDVPAENWVDANLEVEFNVDIGPKVELDIGFVNFFSAKLSAQVGLMAGGTMFAQTHLGDEMPVEDDEKHACDLCLGIDVDIFARGNASFTYMITKDVSDELFNKELFFVSGDLLEKHCSIKNEPESMYGGMKTWGDGACPNYKYKVDVSAVDMFDKPVKNIPVAIQGDSGRLENVTAPESVYLYEGNYNTEATFASGVYADRFSVLGATEFVAKEREMIISGYITSNKTGAAVKDALVKLTLPDGSTKKVYSGSDGFYKFDKLVGGTYSIEVTKDGYIPRYLKNMPFASGTNNNSSFALLADTPTLSATLRKSNGKYTPVYATTSNGEDPGFTLKLEAIVPPYTMGMEAFRLTHSGLSKTFTMDCLCYTVWLFAADMGDGEYTYILNMASDLEEYCVVLREVNGQFEIALDFMYVGETDSTVGLNGMPGDVVDYNGAKYSSSSLTGPFRQNAEFVVGDDGNYILRLHTQEADYDGGTTPIWDVYTDYKMIGDKLTIVNQTVEDW